MIFQVPYWDVANVWPRVAPFIQRALDEQNEWDLASVHSKLTNLNNPMPMQLWVVPWSAALVTQVLTFPKSRKCVLFLCGGEDCLAELKQVPDTIEPWAKSIGCSHFLIVGRKGWRRALPDFNDSGSIMEKDIWHH